MSRRLFTVAFLLLAGALLAAAPPAVAQQVLGTAPDVSTFGHDDSLDGTPAERVSGFYGGDDNDDSNGDALADRVPNSFETFAFTVPEGSNIGSFTVNVTWGDPRLDLDLYVYRVNPATGAPVAGAIASSASFGDTDEEATYYNPIASDPVETDTYLIVVDNWCTSNSDPGASFDICGIADADGSPVEVADEDDFVGRITFGPKLPTNAFPQGAGLVGPDVIKQNALATFTATGSDPDGQIKNYAFDFDGDGRFEYDNAGSPTVTRRFDGAGRFNVGVRLTDDKGSAVYASKLLTVQAPPLRQPIARFSLNRPVFGGRSRSKLVIHYRVRETATVSLSLRSRGKFVKRVVNAKPRVAGRTYRYTLAPRRLKAGRRYQLRLSVRTASGRTQVANLSAKRL